jgi:hypothetical protein
MEAGSVLDGVNLREALEGLIAEFGAPQKLPHAPG